MASSNYLPIFIKQTLLNEEVEVESASFLIDGNWVEVYNPTLNTLYYTSTITVVIVEGKMVRYGEGPIIPIIVDASKASAFQYVVKKK